MKSKEKYRVSYVVVDILRHKLLVPQYVMDNVHRLCSPEAGLVNEYLSNYPGFQIEVFDCEPIDLHKLPTV